MKEKLHFYFEINDSLYSEVSFDVTQPVNMEEMQDQAKHMLVQVGGINPDHIRPVTAEEYMENVEGVAIG